MINSVLKAIEILQTFSTAEPALGLTEISRRVGLPKSTVHNLLATLEARGFIERAEGERYCLGRAIIPLTQNVRINVEFRDRAAPLLRSMADTCHESVYLTALDDGRALYIYAVEMPARLLARTAVGEQVQLHCSAVGKAMLAALADAEVDAIIERVGLPQFTTATITDRLRLAAELQEIRSRGYATDNAEHEAGVYCVGAAIFDDRGHVIGGCSISGTDRQITGSRLPDLAHLVTHTAQQISRYMGYVPTRAVHPIARQQVSLEAGR
jgi:DNA-binding IclR family transcriptional regulator